MTLCHIKTYHCDCFYAITGLQEMAAMGEPSVSPQLEADQGDVKSRTAESFVHVQITSGDDGLSKHDAGLAGKKNRRRTR